MVSVLASGVVDRGFEHCSGQTKILLFSASPLSTQLQGVRARNRGVLLERHVYPWFSEQGIMVSYWSDMFTHDSASKESWCPTGATCLPMIQWARNRGVLVEGHVYPWFSEQGIVVSYWGDMSTPCRCGHNNKAEAHHSSLLHTWSLPRVDVDTITRQSHIIVYFFTRGPYPV
jgi:hypothetical protein